MEIYTGIRGAKFRYFLGQVLTLTNIQAKYIPVLLNEDGMAMYDQVFTHKTANLACNYEYLEFLGDTTLNKAIAWYLSKRFPKLNCAPGVKVLTRLKINLISKKSFAGFAKKLQFWDFVSADMDTRNTKMDKTLEDVFEAFFGATEMLIDSCIQHGTGYMFCYNIIHNLLETEKLSLAYEDLFDAKTRIKELFDYYDCDTLGKLSYITTKEERIHYVTAVREYKGKTYVLGKGYAPLKIDATQRASEVAIASLRQQGFVRPIPEDYALFLK